MFKIRISAERSRGVYYSKYWCFYLILGGRFASVNVLHEVEAPQGNTYVKCVRERQAFWGGGAKYDAARRLVYDIHPPPLLGFVKPRVFVKVAPREN